MKTLPTLAAVLAIAVAGTLSVALDSGATPERTPEQGHLWCFAYPYYNVQAVACVELPVAPVR